MKTLVTLAFALLALLAAPRVAAQSRYTVGQTVANFTLTDRATGRPVQLTDFAGKVVLLEWFAWWCPYCQASASQIESGIVRAYAAKGGNPAGLPVLHVSLNLQPGQETQTQQFVNAYRLGLVLNDFDRAAANRFQSGGQPIFAVINGVAGSASHKQWELVFSQLGYGTTQAPIAALQSAIDSVRAAAPVTTPVVPDAAPTLPSSPTAPTVPTAPTMPAMPTMVTMTTPLVMTGEPVTPLAPAAPAAPVVPTGPTAALVPAGRLSNLSVLTTLAAGQVLTTGFTVQGSPKTALLRVVGPGLARLGVAGALADPRLALYDAAGKKVAENDNWEASLAATFTEVGAFPLPADSRDGALRVTLAPGGYSVQIAAAAAGEGAVLVEIYEVP